MSSDPAPGALPPRRLNLRAFARGGSSLGGSVALQALPRLAASLQAQPGELRELQAQWSLQGGVRRRADGGDEEWVRLRVGARLPLGCQRCLQPVLQQVDDEVTLRLVDEEPRLDAAEVESDEEAYPAREAVDVLGLVEDQLILALPLVPMHQACPQPLPGAEARRPGADAAGSPASPFAVLGALRKGK